MGYAGRSGNVYGRNGGSEKATTLTMNGIKADGEMLGNIMPAMAKGDEDQRLTPSKGSTFDLSPRKRARYSMMPRAIASKSLTFFARNS